MKINFINSWFYQIFRIGWNTKIDLHTSILRYLNSETNIKSFIPPKE